MLENIKHFMQGYWWALKRRGAQDGLFWPSYVAKWLFVGLLVCVHLAGYQWAVLVLIFLFHGSAVFTIGTLHVQAMSHIDHRVMEVAQLNEMPIEKELNQLHDRLIQKEIPPRDL